MGEKNKNTNFEVVREYIDKEGNVHDFDFIDSFDDYESALKFARKQEVIQGRQIAIWETSDVNYLDVVNSWVIKIFLNGKVVELD